MHYLREDIQDLINEQGWDEQSLILLMSNFIDDRELTDKFVEFLEDAADEENSESMDENNEDEDGDDDEP